VPAPWGFSYYKFIYLFMRRSLAGRSKHLRCCDTWDLDCLGLCRYCMGLFMKFPLLAWVRVGGTGNWTRKVFAFSGGYSE